MSTYIVTTTALSVALIVQLVWRVTHPYTCKCGMQFWRGESYCRHVASEVHGYAGNK